ncbi:MAG: ribonuclease P protein component [Arenicella sp.]|jgi:ribonuclease P protein component
MSPNTRSTEKQLPPEKNTSMVNKDASLGMFRLTKRQRLKTPADFQCVYGSKQWGGSKHFTFNVLANDLDLQNTLGVTVSKKVSKRAVDRNHLKRIMREFYRHRQSDLNGVNLVLTAKPSSKKASSKEQLDSLQELWGKVLKWQRWHSREQAKADEHDKIQELVTPRPE